MTALPNFFSLEQRAQLLENGVAATVQGRGDPNPVVKLDCVELNGTWLLTEIDPDQPDIAYGLCFAGRGHPELRYVDLKHLAQQHGRSELLITQDATFIARYPLSSYLGASRRVGYIVTDLDDRHATASAQGH